ncbi:YceD family protein [Candidatus Methylacidiphilum infernorum]|uniref:Predicted metal-binding, possibly nucleic acid-binding protein n=1 Tax=Methylacidiphilum infernorum (isolate V4) TaxID=481448 RepID=B3DVB5_METI4|nr:metal-binding protein [Candidatus Methylacidiphilum infernorum]ACD83268.1 Predicted metal-binding, possibly nucleic acid-binding protein [Methylacidiphilum infernorum V4]
MKILTSMLAEETLVIDNDISSSILDLKEPHLKESSSIRIHLTAYKDDQTVYVYGTLKTSILIQCGRCCNWFEYPIEVPHFKFQLTPPLPVEIDLTERIREDILLALPMIGFCGPNVANGCFGKDLFNEQNKEKSIHGEGIWKVLEKIKKR